MSERCRTMMTKKKIQEVLREEGGGQKESDGRSNGGGDRNKMADMCLCGCL